MPATTVPQANIIIFFWKKKELLRLIIKQDTWTSGVKEQKKKELDGKHRIQISP